MPDGSAVTFWSDAARTAEGLRPRGEDDAQAYVDFDRKVRAIASFLAYVSVATPPDPKSPSLADAIMGLKLGKAFRDLGGKTGREAVRALPMAVADLVQEVFASEAIRGPLATRGVLYTAMGAWATGTAQVFLSDSAGTDGGAAGTAVFPIGGTGALAMALEQAATSLGVKITTGAEVAAIRSAGTRAVGVTLADGTELNAPQIVSGADPKRTAALCDPVTLGPTMVWRTGNIRQPGATARVNFALSGLPAFHGGDAERLAGRIVIGPSIDDVERAMDAVKYGRVSEEPWFVIGDPDAWNVAITQARAGAPAMPELAALLTAGETAGREAISREAFGSFLADQRGFPGGFWQSKDEHALLTVIGGRLADFGLSRDLLSDAKLRAELQRLGQSGTSEADENQARRRQIACVAARINSAAGPAAATRRLYPFADDIPGWEAREPVWLLLNAEERARLLALGIVSPVGGGGAA